MRLAIVTALIAAASLLAAQDKKPGVLIQWKRAGDDGTQAGLFGTRPRGKSPAIPAITNGLQWLTNNQQRDGHWPCEHSKDASVAVTSLCLLAMLGNGSTMRAGPHKAPIKRACAWLRRLQQLKGTGAFADATGAHLLATLAMTEAYHLSEYKLLRSAAVTGIDHAATLRCSDGGWCASPDEESSDPSLTVWGTTLLATAVVAKLDTSDDPLDGVIGWLRSTQANLAPRSGVLGVDVPMNRQAELAHDQSAANAFTLCWLELKGRDPAEPAGMRADAATLTKAALTRARALSRSWEKSPKNKLSINEWFCSSHALAQAGDDKAVEKITKALAAKQLTDGDNKGSWQPLGVWGDAGGRIWTTAMAVLTLEAPYRYAKIVGR